MLWFDVGIKRYTTFVRCHKVSAQLWFDVGIKRYTTNQDRIERWRSCGLMQESKDIQRDLRLEASETSCGLMQESKDIQHSTNIVFYYFRCGLMQESKDIQQLMPNVCNKYVVV